jgi:ribose transport system substrate-binding protein
MRTAGPLASLGLASVLITGVVECVSSQTVDPAQALVALQDKILGKGPNGEEPSPASSVSLSAEEIEKIRGLKAKAAIVLHYARMIGRKRKLPVSNRSLTKWASTSSR